MVCVEINYYSALVAAIRKVVFPWYALRILQAVYSYKARFSSCEQKCWYYTCIAIRKSQMANGKWSR